MSILFTHLSHVKSNSLIKCLHSSVNLQADSNLFNDPFHNSYVVLNQAVLVAFSGYVSGTA